MLTIAILILIGILIVILRFILFLLNIFQNKNKINKKENKLKDNE